MPFEFRLRFHLLPEDRIASPEQIVELPGVASHLHIAAWKRDVPIEDGPRLFVIGGPYDDADLAAADGRRVRKSILLWALERRLAVDLGDGVQRTFFTEAGLEYFSKQVGAPVRQQVHGLDVYEQVEGQRFIELNMQPGLRVAAATTAASIARWYEDNPQLTEKQELAVELYCSAHFDSPFRSRFLTLMTALEALLDHEPRPDNVVSVVKELEQLVESSSLENKQKQSLRSSLSYLHAESIGQAGRRIAGQLLPHGIYAGLSSAKYFSDCYELRSTVVHTGRVPVSVDLLEITSELHRFAGDLLHASIRIRPTT